MNRINLMNHKLLLIVPVFLAALLGSVIAASADPKPGSAGLSVAPIAQNPMATKHFAFSAAPLSPVGSSFTFQGNLNQGGNPSNGQFDFQFALFDAQNGGNQQGSLVTLLNQTVVNGLYTVNLDFGASAFQGDVRWLQMSVRVASSGGYNTLSPRYPILPVPYAMSLMPGAIINGSTTSPAALIEADNHGNGPSMFAHSYADGNGVLAVSELGYGVYGQTNASNGVPNAAGVVGVSAHNRGVYGASANPGDGRGVMGQSTSGEGVYGLSASSYGVRGDSQTNVGVYGQTGSASSAAVSGNNTGGGPGVRGDSSSSIGVWGTSSSNVGVYGTSSSYYGVYGFSDNGYGVNGYSNNDVGGHFTSVNSDGLYATSSANHNGVWGNNSANGNGVYGTSTSGYGVQGVTSTTLASNLGAVYGNNTGSGPGVLGVSTSGYGVRGTSASVVGVLGTSTSGVGGFFSTNDNEALQGNNNSPTAGAIVGRNAGGGTSIAGISVSNGKGVYGESPGGYGVQGTSTSGTGVYGSTSGNSGAGVRGDNTNAGAAGVGVYGSGNGGTGVYGQSTNNFGVYGFSTNGGGVRGSSSNGAGGYFSSIGGEGVYGYSNSGYGLHGDSTANTAVYGSSNGIIGVYGTSSLNSGIGVQGVVSSTQYAVYGNNTGSGPGVYGTSSGGYGVYGGASSAANAAVYGNNTGGGTGVAGVSTSGSGMSGTSTSLNGVVGVSTSGNGVYGITSSANNGVIGQNSNALGNGVAGINTSGAGIYGQSTSGYAGWFQGNVHVTGTCCGASAGTYQIDDPADPANKYLNHAAVESSDQKDIYDGVAVLDARGEATVQLPNWFQALNKDFRYQLTCIGGFAQVYIAQEVQNNRFKIAGGRPGLKVSWQITGTRHDPYADKHPIQVEQNKIPGERGLYLHPDLYGQPDSKRIVSIQQPQQPGASAKPLPGSK